MLGRPGFHITYATTVETVGRERQRIWVHVSAFIFDNPEAKKDMRDAYLFVPFFGRACLKEK